MVIYLKFIQYTPLQVSLLQYFSLEGANSKPIYIVMVYKKQIMNHGFYWKLNMPLHRKHQLTIYLFIVNY
jgi:hypothetical protein